MKSIITFMIENKYGIMSNEEAIAILQNIKPVPYRGDCKSTTRLLVTAALDMAIKALKETEMTEEMKKGSKQKTGKWIKYASPRCGEQHYKCTNCGDYINFGQFGDFYTKDFKFCPHCGVKMGGESND